MSIKNIKNANNSEKEKWNMAQDFLARLDTRCDERDQFATRGDLLSWFRSLRTIFRNINFEIIKPGHEDEEKELDDLFKKALVALKNASNVRQDLSQLGISDTEGLLDEIDRRLNNLMYKYGLLFPTSNKRNLEAEVEEGWFD